MNQRQRQFKKGLSALKGELKTRASRRLVKRSDKICAIRPALYNARGMTVTNQIISGNSIEVLNSGPEGWIDLVFADPPFNIGYLYHGYDDQRKAEDYLQAVRAKLAEAVLYPSRQIREGYQQATAATADGRVIAGLVRSESADTLTLRDAEGKDHAIPKTEIEERTASSASLMPEGLHVDLSMQDFADLISYLESLKGSPATVSRPVPTSDH